LRADRPRTSRADKTRGEQRKSDLKDALGQSPGHGPRGKYQRRARTGDQRQAADPIQRIKNDFREPFVVGPEAARGSVGVCVVEGDPAALPDVESRSQMPPCVALSRRKASQHADGGKQQPNSEAI